MKIELNNREYNIVVQALRSQAIDLWKKIVSLDKDDFRRKSYGCDLYAINTLLDNLRKQLNRQI